MDFLTGNIKHIYFRYLSAAFGSAMITSVYSIVDTAMVGQYHGPEGTAALPVLAGAEALWLAMPITEVLVIAAAVMRSYTAALKG
mgnify:CR=1 FL=1